MAEEKKTKEKPTSDNIVNNVTVGMGASEIVNRYGEAGSQFVQAYNGTRYDSLGNELAFSGRSLKDISNYNINPDYAAQNIKQHAGFSAELIDEAKKNADAIINNDTTRYRTTDGIGRTNDTQYDLVKVDSAGNISDPVQMKFLGVDKQGRYNVIEKIVKDESWERYDTAIDIPQDQYDGAYAYAQNQADKLMEQANQLRENGQIDKAIEKENLAERYQEAADKIRPSDVTESEAIFATKDPEVFTAKQVISNAHQAGVEAAKVGFVVGGSVALLQNMYHVYNGEISIEEGFANVAVTTAKAGATAYGVGSVGSGIKALMHSSKNDIVRKLGNTSLPTMIVTSAIQVTSIVKRYVSGEMTETEVLEELGQSGIGTLSAGYGAAVGTLVLPGIGTIVGSMVGYMISSSIYGSCLQIMHEADIAREKYMQTKALCEAAREEMRQQRLQFEAKAAIFFDHREKVFAQSLENLMTSLEKTDTKDFTNALSALACEFGKELPFQSFEEFDDFMLDDSAVFVL